MEAKKKKPAFIDFNDKSLPLGKRKLAYVKYACSKGTKLDEAKKQANRKFGMVKKGKIFVIFQYDTWMLDKPNYFGDIMYQMQRDRYEDFKYGKEEDVTPQEIEKYKSLGYKIHYQGLWS